MPLPWYCYVKRVLAWSSTQRYSLMYKIFSEKKSKACNLQFNLCNFVWLLGNLVLIFIFPSFDFTLLFILLWFSFILNFSKDSYILILCSYLPIVHPEFSGGWCSMFLCSFGCSLTAINNIRKVSCEMMKTTSKNYCNMTRTL